MREQQGADLEIRVTGSNAADELRSLSSLLSEGDMLRGRARLVGAPPGPGTMGAAAESILVALGPGGVMTSVAAVLIAWLRCRTTAVCVQISRPDGRVMRLEAMIVGRMPPQQVQDLTDSVAALLAAADVADGRDASGTTRR